MMKEKILKLIIVLLLICIVALFLLANFGKNIFNDTNVEYDGWNKYKNKNDFILLIVNDNYDNTSIKEIADYYKDSYAIQIDELNISDFDSDSYKDFIHKLNLDDSNTWLPLMYIKRGNDEFIIQNVITDGSFKNALIKNGYINESVGNYDIVVDNDIFDKIYGDSQDSLVYFCAFSGNYYKYRKYISKLATTNNFVIYSSNSGESGTDHMFNAFADIVNQYNSEGGFDMIAIIGNGGIKKFLKIDKESDIDKFLRDNSYIK